MAVNLASFGRWTLRDKAAQRRSLLRWMAGQMGAPISLTIRKVALIAAVLPLCVMGAEPIATDVARRYVELRPGVLSVTQSAGPVEPEKLRSALASISQQVLSELGRGPTWNADHPEWKRLSAIIEDDVERALRDFFNDPLLKDIPKKTEEVFAKGMATRLSSAELDSLVRYYSEKEGAALAEVQKKMFDDIGATLAKAHVDTMSGLRSRQGNKIGSTPEAKEIMGLFDEWVRIQWALVDPGPSGDRSGLQAIPKMVQIALDLEYERYISLWRGLPEEYRRTIVERRESDLAKKEREAIFEAAKGLNAVIRPEEQRKKLISVLVALENRWRALVPTQ